MLGVQGKGGRQQARRWRRGKETVKKGEKISETPLRFSLALSRGQLCRQRCSSVTKAVKQRPKCEVCADAEGERERGAMIQRAKRR